MSKAGQIREMISGDFQGTDRELAKLIGRTVRAIQMRRYLLKK